MAEAAGARAGRTPGTGRPAAAASGRRPASSTSGSGGSRRPRAGTTGGRAPSAADGTADAREFAGSARAAAGSQDAGPDPGALPPFRPLGGGHVCPVAFCPVGMALTFAESARPEVVQHLMAAGAELMLAVKALIDARAEAVANASGLEHIRIR